MPHTAAADRSHTQLAADTPCPVQQPGAAKLSPITRQARQTSQTTHAMGGFSLACGCVGGEVGLWARVVEEVWV